VKKEKAKPDLLASFLFTVNLKVYIASTVPKNKVFVFYTPARIIGMAKMLGFPGWEAVYRGKKVTELPWYFKDLDVDLRKELEARSITSGRFLDIGTGPGTQAIALANMGFSVTGTDISETAIKGAKSLEGADKVAFMVDDMIASGLKENSFDFIIDRGAFHCLEPAQRDAYLRTVRKTLADGGILFLKCFSIDEPRDEGPHKFSKDDIRNIFSNDFVIESIKDSIYYGVIEPHPKVLFCVLRKK
jgi:2-polyprenyl-3-methyl-5-hydroxy-6-metoxy-1,4-benzoquinol methylase